jgi:uracil-DNA glycosylase
VVVLLGATAGQAVYGSSFRVTASRGRPLPWPEDHPLPLTAPMCVATAHPASVLRSRQRDADLAALVSDLQVARRLQDAALGERAGS